MLISSYWKLFHNHIIAGNAGRKLLNPIPSEILENID